MWRALYLCLMVSFPAGWASASDSYHSMWVEPNYVDTQYSALFDGLNVAKANPDHSTYDHIPLGWIPYFVSAEVIDVYKGDLERGETIEILVYISALSARSQLEKIRNTFILSFCRSVNGTYYTSRDYLIQTPTKANIEKFEMVRQHGTYYEGSGDCQGNYPSLNPDNHDR